MVCDGTKCGMPDKGSGMRAPPPQPCAAELLLSGSGCFGCGCVNVRSLAERHLLVPARRSHAWLVGWCCARAQPGWFSCLPAASTTPSVVECVLQSHGGRQLQGGQGSRQVRVSSVGQQRGLAVGSSNRGRLLK